MRDSLARRAASRAPASAPTANMLEASPNEDAPAPNTSRAMSAIDIENDCENIDTNPISSTGMRISSCWST
ncbi:hypothetical protein GCM10020001_037310 [Nonomuraea salmonea]